MQYQTFNNNNVNELKYTFEVVDSYWIDRDSDEPFLVEISCLDGSYIIMTYFLTTMFKHEPELGLYTSDGITGYHVTSEQFAELRAFLVMFLNAKGYSVEEYWDKYASKWDKEEETLYL